MAGLGEIAAPPKFLCCAREQMLREHSLHGQKAAKSRLAIIGVDRNE